jgi:hypothetical protein
MRLNKQGAAAAVAGLLLAGAAGIAIAQQAPSAEGGQRARGPTPEIAQRMIDGRLAWLKAALRLTPEQEGLWPALENVIRENAAERMRLRQERRQAREERREERRDLVQRLDQIGSRLDARAAAVKRLSTALKPLYATFSDEQKEVMRVAIANAMRARHRFGRWHQHHHRG